MASPLAVFPNLVGKLPALSTLLRENRQPSLQMLDVWARRLSISIQDVLDYITVAHAKEHHEEYYLSSKHAGDPAAVQSTREDIKHDESEDYDELQTDGEDAPLSRIVHLPTPYASISPEPIRRRPGTRADAMVLKPNPVIVSPETSPAAIRAGLQRVQRASFRGGAGGSPQAASRAAPATHKDFLELLEQHERRMDTMAHKVQTGAFQRFGLDPSLVPEALRGKN